MIGELYGKAKATISEHIKNIFAEGELDENSVVRLYRTTAADGKSYNVQYFSLSLVLAVGYRVRSSRGTQFRQWATQTLQEYLIKGFVMDDERLKNPPVGHITISYARSAEVNGRLRTQRHFPIQKLEKIRPSRSSEVNSPVISLRDCCASRSSSASNSPA